MARELDATMDLGEASLAASCVGEDNSVSFLAHVIQPIYDTLSKEAERNNNGKAAHSALRNYTSLLYRLILFKPRFPEYVDSYLRLAAIAKARNNVPLSIELIRDALEVDDKNLDALCMLGDLELKIDDQLKAKDLT